MENKLISIIFSRLPFALLQIYFFGGLVTTPMCAVAVRPAQKHWPICRSLKLPVDVFFSILSAILIIYFLPFIVEVPSLLTHTYAYTRPDSTTFQEPWSIVLLSLALNSSLALRWGHNAVLSITNMKLSFWGKYMTKIYVSSRHTSPFSIRHAKIYPYCCASVSVTGKRVRCTEGSWQVMIY